MLGCGDECGVAVGRAFAVAHFNEDDGVVVEHDQIDFAVAGSVVAGQKFEADAFELCPDPQFKEVAGGARR